MSLTQSLNLGWNLSLLKRIIFSHSLVSSFTPISSCIENNDLSFNVKNCINIDLKCLILRWCHAQDLFGSQIPVTTGGFEL